MYLYIVKATRSCYWRTLISVLHQYKVLRLQLVHTSDTLVDYRQLNTWYSLPCLYQNMGLIKKEDKRCVRIRIRDQMLIKFRVKIYNSLKV